MLPSHTFLALFLVIVGAETEEPKVRTPSGSFRGRNLVSFSGEKYTSYRGIPYALPPTGDKRFAKPVRFPDVKGDIDATEYGPICAQNAFFEIKGQEDCLYLNVFTPLNEQETSNDNLKKVLVYIHGGGFIIGDSNLQVPGDLVTRGDVIVVTMNYRLGWFGSLRGNTTSLPGNQAFWDQLMALHWVKDNIKSFGGDPDDVTVSGESAGSMSVSLLSVSPLAKGLFSKALLLSGTSTVFPSVFSTSNDLLQKASEKFGCRVDSLSGNEDAVVECLKGLPAVNFLSEFNNGLVRTFTSYGDELSPKDMKTAIDDPDFLADVGFYDRDYLASVTKEDGSILVNSIFGKIDTSSIDASVEDASRFFQFPKDLMKSIILEYQKIYENLGISVIALFTDAVFTRGSLVVLDAFQSRPKSFDHRNGYMMSFDHSPIYVPNQYMLHALDLVYLFDLSPKELAINYYFDELDEGFPEQDRQLKSEYFDLVTSFMKTGNPSENLAKQKGISLPPYDLGKRSFLSFSLNPSIGEDVLGNRRIIWEQLVPQWLKKYNDSKYKQEL